MNFPIKLRKRRRKNNFKEIKNSEKAPSQLPESTQLISVSFIKRRKTKDI